VISPSIGDVVSHLLFAKLFTSLQGVLQMRTGSPLALL
jgi:hypothetical protein